MPGAGLAGVSSPSGGAAPSFLAGIAAGVKLKQTGDGAPAGGSNFSRPARRVSKRYDASTLLHASDNRKAVGLTASKKMKQLQWEKLNKMRTDNTIWEKAEEPEMEIVAELQRRNIFSEMEDEFKAREIATDAMGESPAGAFESPLLISRCVVPCSEKEEGGVEECAGTFC
jgi:cytokinesis protein